MRIKAAVLFLFVLGLLTFAGTASAYKGTHMCYASANAYTIDGKWTTTTEWTDGQPTNFGANAAFRDKYDFQSSGGSFVVSECIIIETWDNTNDAGDYWQLCLDPTLNGGAAPQSDDYKIEITGHGSTATVSWFKGTGTAWATTSAIAGALTWAETSATSPTTSAAHYILEVKLDKTSFGMNPEIAYRVGQYDAHTGGYGLQAWPPTTTLVNSGNIPDDWGDIPYTSEAIPEGFSTSLVLVLSAIAFVAGSVFLRKRISMPKY